MGPGPESESAMNGAIMIEQGSGNVFVDLGYLNAEEMLIKAKLVQRILQCWRRRV